MTESERRTELGAKLAQVQRRITDAARDAGRDPADVRLIVVTKTFPASDLRLLFELGVRDVGENRHPEAGDKVAALSDLTLSWHFIGQVQSNKAAHIAGYADVVHSVDSAKLVHRLGNAAHAAGRVVSCLVQVSLDAPGTGEGRAGVEVSAIAELADLIAVTDGLRIGGLMGVAPLGQPPEPAFDRLHSAWADLRRSHPDATMLSAGMSGDFEAAIRAGATHVRVGSAVMGARPRLG